MLELDKEGYLKNLSDWNVEAARQLAAAEQIELTEAHWEIIRLLRDFHARSGLSPIMRVLVKLARDRYGPAKGNSIYLMKLFPGNPALIASKIAGLPRPANCP